MTVRSDLGAGRWGVYRRERGRPWALVVHAGDRRAAEALMVRLAREARHSADWVCGPLSDPPSDDRLACR